MTISERIARNVKYLCHKQGMKLGDLEEKLGVHAGYFSRVRGRRLIPIDTVGAVAFLLGVDERLLMYRDFAKSDKIERVEWEISKLEAELATLKEGVTI